MKKKCIQNKIFINIYKFILELALEHIPFLLQEPRSASMTTPNENENENNNFCDRSVK